MGVSTDAYLAYGFQFDEDTEFPWGEEDAEEWWRNRSGYKSEFQKPFAEFSDEDWDKEFKNRRAFDKKHPMPVELVQHCSGECPMYAIAMQGSVIRATRGNPVNVDEFLEKIMVDSTEGVGVTRAEALNGFIEMLKAESNITPTSDVPNWWLFSNWL